MSRDKAEHEFSGDAFELALDYLVANPTGVDNGTDTALDIASFDNVARSQVVFDGSGPGAINMFKVVGSVEIEDIYGHCATAFSADVGNAYVDLYDGTASVNITNNPGPDVSSAPVCSLFLRTEDSTNDMVVLSSAAAAIAETTSFRATAKSFVANAKAGADTYIRVITSGVATSGIADVYCKWRPLEDGSYVEPA